MIYIAIQREYIIYEDLYSYNEEELFTLFKEKNEDEFKFLLWKFENIKKEDIPNIELPKVKIRKLNPIVNGTRVKVM